MSNLEYLAGAIIVMGAGALIALIILYIVTAIALTKAGRAVNTSGSTWMAWVPIANLVYFALLGVSPIEEEIEEVTLSPKHKISLNLYQWVGVAGLLVMIACSAFFSGTSLRVINNIAVLANTLITTYLYTRAIMMLDGRDPADAANSVKDLILGFLSALIPFVGPIILIIKSSRTPMTPAI